MMFLMMVRVDDPLVPRAMFGVLNTLLFFPSGAISPVSVISQVASSHRAHRSLYLRVHGFKAILLKDGGFAAIRFDLLFLLGLESLLLSPPTFKRTL